MQKILCLMAVGIIGSAAGYLVATSTSSTLPEKQTDALPAMSKKSLEAPGNTVSEPLKAQRIVQDQKLQDELWEACQRRNIQACKEIGLTDKDIEFQDKWQETKDQYEDTNRRIDNDAMKAKTETLKQETIRLQNEIKKDQTSIQEKIAEPSPRN
jgi:gas vesicle protein